MLGTTPLYAARSFQPKLKAVQTLVLRPYSRGKGVVKGSCRSFPVVQLARPNCMPPLGLDGMHASRPTHAVCRVILSAHVCRRWGLQSDLVPDSPNQVFAEAVDSVFFHPLRTRNPMVRPKPFLFLSVFKWEHRTATSAICLTHFPRIYMCPRDPHRVLCCTWRQKKQPKTTTTTTTTNPAFDADLSLRSDGTSAGKGYDALLRAFWEEFVDEPPGLVELQLRTYKPPWEPGSEDLMEQIADLAMLTGGKELTALPRVRWMHEDLSRHALRGLYDSADAFVLPTRGEGWGLPIVEAMAMAEPVIVTNFSGPTAYISDETGFPVAVASHNYDVRTGAPPPFLFI